MSAELSRERILPSVDSLGLEWVAGQRDGDTTRTGAHAVSYDRFPPLMSGRGAIRRNIVLRMVAGQALDLASGFTGWAIAEPLPVGRVDVALGAATGDPIGMPFVRSRFLPNDEYEVVATDVDGRSCTARAACRVDRDHPRQGSASPVEVWLAEQAVRAMVANWRGVEFTFGLGPPTDYLAVPRRVALDGQPIVVARLAERWPYERVARSHPVPKPVAIGDVVFVSSPYLEATGLTVSFGDWAYWGRPREPNARPVDQALLDTIRSALVGRERRGEGLRLGYLTEYDFEPAYAAELRHRRKLPENVTANWSLHWEWSLPPGARRVDVLPLNPPADGPLPWRHWHDSLEMGILPDGVPGLVQSAWDQREAGPLPLLLGWGREPWSALFARADGFELGDEPRSGRPHHRLRLIFGEANSSTGVELWLPPDAPDSPAAMRWTRADGLRERHVLETDGYARLPNGLSVPTGLVHQQWFSLGRQWPAQPNMTVVYSGITALPGADAALARDLERPLKPILH